MSRSPPFVWVFISLASLFILVGYDGAEFNAPAFILGVAFAITGFGLALWLAYGRWRERPRARGLEWLLPMTAAFFVICAIAAATLGPAYAVAVLGAGVVPATAAALILATARAKTVGDDEGLRETTAAADRDPFPGVGMDDETPLGDTPEHSDAERVAKPDPRVQRRERSRH
jgi:hypothetical protein